MEMGVIAGWRHCSHCGRWSPTRLCNTCKNRYTTKRREKKEHPLWNVLLEIVDNRCPKCDSIEELTLDHVKPLSKKGSWGWRNTQPLCRKCNTSKENDDSIDYLGEERRKQFMIRVDCYYCENKR